MRTGRRRTGRRQVPQRVLAWLAVAGVLGWCGLGITRTASADSVGCTLHPMTTPEEDAQCVKGGDGCYLCEYYYTGAGFTTCSENIDGSFIGGCVDGLHALDQNWDDEVEVPLPVQPAGGGTEIPTGRGANVTRSKAGQGDPRHEQ